MGRKRMTDAEKAESARIRKARSRAKQQEPTQSGYLPNTSQVQPEHSSPLQSSPPPLILSASPETSNSRQQSQVLCDRGLESEFEKLNIIGKLGGWHRAFHCELTAVNLFNRLQSTCVNVR